MTFPPNLQAPQAPPRRKGRIAAVHAAPAVAAVDTRGIFGTVVDVASLLKVQDVQVWLSLAGNMLKYVEIEIWVAVAKLDVHRMIFGH